jgi:hypothetical protein
MDLRKAAQLSPAQAQIIVFFLTAGRLIRGEPSLLFVPITEFHTLKTVSRGCRKQNRRWSLRGKSPGYSVAFTSGSESLL